MGVIVGWVVAVVADWFLVRREVRWIAQDVRRVELAVRRIEEALADAARPPEDPADHWKGGE